MKIKELILQIKDTTFEDILEYLTKNAIKADKKTFVVTINTEIVMFAKSDKAYEKVLKSADLLLNDSIGLVWARKMFGKSSLGRIHGADLLEKLSEAASKKPISVGYLGGGKNVALDVSECLKEKYPGLKVSFAEAEWPKENAEVAHEISKTARAEKVGSRPSSSPANSRFGNSASSPRQIINHKSSIINPKMSADILFVAFGSPKQEKWIYENLPKMSVNVAIGVGGAFDFVSGRVRRAPVWVRKIGLEWLFRLIIQPWRIKRQMALPKFVLLVIAERLGL